MRLFDGSILLLDDPVELEKECAKAFSTRFKDEYDPRVKQAVLTPYARGQSRHAFERNDGIQIYVDDVGDGHRASHFLLLLAKTLKNTILLVEEPELHQHPSAIERLMSGLCEICKQNDLQLFVTTHSPEVFKLSWNNPKCQHIWNNIDYSNNDLQVLCGFNTTRVKLNNVIRTKLNYTQKAPYPNEKIICLANNYFTNIMNGQIGKVIWLIPIDEGYRITLDIDGDIYECDVSNRCFGEVNYKLYNSNKKKKEYNFENKNLSFFDYGYTISVHKSQGSEWDKVIMFEQRSRHWDDVYYTKWLYTGITRSREKLFIISDYWG